MKKALIFAASAFAAIMANADVMNWQVADPELSGYNYAKLYWSTSETPSATDASANELATTYLEDGYGSKKQIDLTAAGVGTSGTYFFIEVGNYDRDVFQVAQRGVNTYSELVNAGLISTGSMETPVGVSYGSSAAPITPSYSPVPEPGTAGLILLGLAVAGLKRRRV